MSDMPEGFNCATCGKRHEFGMYVAAHWDELLTHTCDSCGAQHHVQRGVAEQIKAGNAK